jgi:hypothetical protein
MCLFRSPLPLLATLSYSPLVTSPSFTSTFRRAMVATLASTLGLPSYGISGLFFNVMFLLF